MGPPVTRWATDGNARSLVQARRALGPCIAFLGGEQFEVVVTRFTEVAWDEFAAQPWPRGEVHGPLPLYRGYVGCLAYDDFAGDACASRVFRIEQCVVFDRQRREAWIVGEGEVAVDSVDADAPRPVRLTPDQGDEHYLSQVKDVQEDIRSGRYYQINLLRYFQAHGIAWSSLLARLEAVGGPMSCVFDVPGMQLASFSPERFVAMVRAGDRLQASTFPIKGTSSPDSGLLADSEKDLAELHMIVDLMRHDMTKIARTGTVEVLDRQQLRSFKTVDHLQATVTASVRDGQTVGEVLKALCPAGSITGAPKREVMQAIREYEGRDRGFFMGNAFMLDESGRFDSSVLIRTLQNLGAGWEFAAGSGLTIQSSAPAELEEISTKCQVVSRDLVGDGAGRPACYSGGRSEEGDVRGTERR